ncbi:MAG: S8 family serine peptidase [Actinomycetota bacterium]
MRIRALSSALVLLGLVLGRTSPAPAADATYVPVRVGVGELAAAGVEASWVEHYGAFDWAAVSESDLHTLEGVSGFEAHPEARTLVLPSATFDPLVSVPGASGLRIEGEALRLVQFRAPTRDLWLSALRSRGARLVQPIAPFGYVVLADASSISSIRGLSFVRWAGAFDAAYRFGDLELSDGPTNVVLLDGAGLRTSVRAISSLAQSLEVTGSLPFMDVRGVGLQVDVSSAALEAIAKLPNVYSISPQRRGMPRGEASDQVVAGNYNAQGQPQTGYRTWLASHNIDGDGVIIAHVDDGYSTAHPDTVGTVSGCLNYRVPTHTCDGTVGNHSDFHGQHTGGIIVGTGTVPATDPDGFQHGLGVAPGAQLFDQNFIALGAAFGYSGPGQYVNLNRDSVLGSATTSANSWGPSGSPEGYDADTREFDLAPRDANPATPAHEALNFVLSIMNGSGGSSTQGSPDEGKNLLRVGGTKDIRAGDIDDLCTCSAHGPALDGRLLPDVVAPGQGVTSTANAGTIALCIDPVADPGAPLYTGCTGTSMASPHVSGASALFTQYYRRQFGNTPSPALIKGAFVNGAVDLAGGKDADGKVMGHIPNNKQGWGRLNLQNVFGVTEKAYVDQSVTLGSSGETYSTTVQPVDPSKPVKVTLVWTDAPGHGLGGDTPAWVNDLDLRVTAGGVTYLGNSFGTPSTGWSVAGGTADFMNNLENVFLQTAPSGAITVQVGAANIAGDGVPGNADDTDQDFALIVSNGRVAV